MRLHFGRKKTEFLDKSSKTIDIVPVFFEPKWSPSRVDFELFCFIHIHIFSSFTPPPPDCFHFRWRSWIEPPLCARAQNGVSCCHTFGWGGVLLLYNIIRFKLILSLFIYPHEHLDPLPDGMRCCRSDWPGLCLFCCEQPSCLDSQQNWFGFFFVS